MSASRAFFDAISAHRRARTANASEDDTVEMGDFDDDIGDELADRESFIADWFNSPEPP